MKRIVDTIGSIPHLFGKIIVVWCVAFGTAASVYALRILSRTGSDASATLAIILSFFGGELLVLCLKTIIKDKKRPSQDENTEE